MIMCNDEGRACNRKPTSGRCARRIVCGTCPALPEHVCCSRRARLMETPPSIPELVQMFIHLREDTN